MDNHHYRAIITIWRGFFRLLWRMENVWATYAEPRVRCATKWTQRKKNAHRLNVPTIKTVSKSLAAHYFWVVIVGVVVFVTVAVVVLLVEILKLFNFRCESIVENWKEQKKANREERMSIFSLHFRPFYHRTWWWWWWMARAKKTTTKSLLFE